MEFQVMTSYYIDIGAAIFGLSRIFTNVLVVKFSQ